VKSVLEIILKKDKNILLLFYVYTVIFPVPELWRLTAYVLYSNRSRREDWFGKKKTNTVDNVQPVSKGDTEMRILDQKTYWLMRLR
jgi:hypothetical protein